MSTCYYAIESCEPYRPVSLSWHLLIVGDKYPSSSVSSPINKCHPKEKGLVHETIIMHTLLHTLKFFYFYCCICSCMYHNPNLK